MPELYSEVATYHQTAITRLSTEPTTSSKTTTTTTTLSVVNRVLAKDQYQRCTNVENEMQTTNSNQDQNNNINQMFQHHPHLSSCPQSVGGRRVTTVILAKKQRKILNPTSISVALISYIIFNQSIMLAIMSSGKNFAVTSLAANGVSGGANNNNLLAGFRHKMAVDVQETAKRSLIGMVSAEPAPEPAASSTRSAGSGSYRQPPLNGSMYGKRSVNRPTVSGSSNQKQQQQQGTKTTTNNQSQHDSSRLDSQEQLKYPQKQNEPPSRANSDSASNGANNRYQQLQQASITATSQSAGERSSATDYKDIITGIIEDFLALNNESNPDEASVAFCRMIIYECNQMLHTRSKSLARRKRKRIQ